MMLLRFALVSLLAALPLSGFAGNVELPSEIGVGFSVPVKSMKEMLAEIRFRSTVRQKLDYSCGSAAVATLLTYHYQRPVSEDDAIQFMYTRGDQAKIQREGFSLLDIQKYLASLGYKADGFQVPLDKLVGTSTPAITLIRDNGFNHFVVVKGVRGDTVLLGDPVVGSRIMSRADFDKLWVSKILFVIHSHPDVAKFNVATHWHVRPTAMLDQAVSRDSLAAITLLRPDPVADF